MPRRKIEEKDEELDIRTPVKKETYVTKWFRDHAVNNATELKIICDLTSRSAEEQFFLSLKSGNTEVYGVVFYGTFLTILDFLRSKQKKWNNFTIEICNSINIGYTNNDNERNEKVGNFMPIMEYISINHNVIADTSNLTPDKTSDNFIRWKSLNLKKNLEACNEIQETSFNRLMKDFHVNLRESESIIPLFCIFMDNITNVLKQKFKEAQGTDVSEVSMNVFGLFDAYYSFDPDENREVIDFQPNIMMKLALKSDEIASKE